MVVWMIATTAASLPPEGERDAWQGMRMATEAPHVPDGAYDRARDGKVVTGLDDVPGSRLRKAWGVAVVPVSIDAMWAAINDNASKTRLTKIRHVELLEGTPCTDDRLVFQYLDVRWLTDRWWVVRQRWNTSLWQRSEGRVRELFWRSEEVALPAGANRWAQGGIPLPFTEGAWMLVDLGEGRTLVEYFSWSDPGGAIPARLASRFAAGGIEDTLEAMVTLAREGSTCPHEVLHPAYEDAVALP